MSTITEERRLAASLPEGDVVAVLLEQHARIRELFEAVTTADPDNRKRVFDELRKVLAVHETAEEMVLRPISRRVAGKDVVDERMQEEADATKALEALEELDCADPQFDAGINALRHLVESHADAEEREEFPAVLEKIDKPERQALGLMLKATEKVAPTHAHGSVAGSTEAQLVAGPFAALKDRARDLFKR